MNNIKKAGYNLSSGVNFLLSIPSAIIAGIFWILSAILYILRFPFIFLSIMVLTLMGAYSRDTRNCDIHFGDFIKYAINAVTYMIQENKLIPWILSILIVSIIVSVIVGWIRSKTSFVFKSSSNAYYDRRSQIEYNNKKIAEIDKKSKYKTEKIFTDSKVSDFKKSNNYIER